MSVTITLLADEQNISLGPVPVSFVTLAPDNSYPTGGYGTSLGVTAANLYCGRGINGILFMGGNTAAVGYTLFWNTQTSKLEVLISAGFTPAGTNSAPTLSIFKAAGIANTSPLLETDANNVRLVNNTIAADRTGITGVQAPVFTGTAVAAGAMVEVTNGTDLSTLTFNLFVVGQR